MISIRRARTEERQALEELQRRASLALEEYREQLLAYPDAIDLPAEHLTEGTTLIAEVDGAIAGFAVLLGAELDGLFVDPGHWKQGIGSALVEAIVHETRKEGLSLSVVASPTSRSFYEKCGFSVEGEVETRFGPALRMSR